LAQELGINSAAISCFIRGDRQLPLNRFIQIVNIKKVPQPDIDEIFNLYLEDVGVPADALRLVRAGSETPGASPEGSVIRDARIAKVTSLIMASDIKPEAKVKVYEIIQATRPEIYDAEQAVFLPDILENRDARIAKIVEKVMASDIDSEAKVKVYNIIQSTARKK
jgi:hypothetical protein